MSTIASHSPLNISETVRDRPRGLVPKDDQYYGQLPLSAHVAAVCRSVYTTSCASYGRLPGHCLKMRVKHWSGRSSPVA